MLLALALAATVSNAPLRYDGPDMGMTTMRGNVRIMCAQGLTATECRYKDRLGSQLIRRFDKDTKALGASSISTAYAVINPRVAPTICFVARVGQDPMHGVDGFEKPFVYMPGWKLRPATGVPELIKAGCAGKDRLSLL